MLGIDTDDFAVRLARVVLWIGHALAVERHHLLGEPGPIPPSDAEAALRRQDAPLPLPAITSVVRADALYADWPSCDAIVGNPPFIGSQHLREHLGDDAVKRLSTTFKVGVREYVTYWFRRAQDHLGPGQRAGLVATNSVREGRAREVSLDYVQAEGGVITEAISSLPWEGDANVHVSLVNWVREPAIEPERFLLDEHEVVGITSSLTRGRPVPPPAKLAGNAGRSFQGVIPVGDGFELTEAEAQELLGRTDANYGDVVRPYLKGKDLTESPTQTPRQWIVDFGDRALETAMRFPAALDVVRERVRPERERIRDDGTFAQSRKSRRDNWWRFGELALGMRRAIQPVHRFIAVNEYGKRVEFSWQTSSVIPNNKTIAIASSDDAVMGVLLSRPHRAWLQRWGGTIKADLHYTPTYVFETFPFPDADRLAEHGVAGIAKDLVDLRRSLCVTDPENPIGLTTLYNQVDDGAHRDLARLHADLDKAVLKAYGWPLRLARRNETDEDELLDRLYALNLEIASGGRPGYEAFPAPLSQSAPTPLF